VVSDLRRALEGWTPDGVTTSEVVHSWPSAAFSAVLEHEGPAVGVGDPLPPLWHWFHFLDTPRQSELGEDGHPAQGRFMPPIPDRRRMIAGGRLEVRSPIRIGDRITRRAELAEVHVKDGRSGQMVFVTTRYAFFAGEELLLTEEQDVVYRSQPPGQARALAERRPVAEPPAQDWQLTCHSSPQLLFRFSALTYNTHRIHYDQPYVTAVEGYPGLVVHGPLLALLLLEIPRRHVEGQVTTFDYRLTSPVIVGDTVLATGVRADTGLVLSGAVVGGGPSITGNATLT